MLTCSQFSIHRHKVRVNKIGQPINLYCFGDVHRFSKGCAVDKWHSFLDLASKDKDALFLGMGDYDDLVSASERAILINPDLHEDTQWTIDDLYTQRINDFIKEISFMRGKLIGLVEGNHYGIFSNGGMTTTQKMCEILKCRYLGVNAFIRLGFLYGVKTCSLDIFAHHGKGAARLIGSSLNSVEQMVSNAEASIYLMGHDHQKNAGKVNRLHLQEGNGILRLKDKTMILARTGSFLRGYIPDHHSYVVKGALKPSELGFLKIILTPTRTQTTNQYQRRDDFFEVKMEAVI